MTHFAKLGEFGLLLEAEVAPAAQSSFEERYEATTRTVVSPGNPVHYQDQPNKWGAELRVYFDDPGMAVSLEAHGVFVEFPRKGYKAGEYRYRFNDNELWWKLVEDYGLLLGSN